MYILFELYPVDNHEFKLNLWRVQLVEVYGVGLADSIRSLLKLLDLYIKILRLGEEKEYSFLKVIPG